MHSSAEQILPTEISQLVESSQNSVIVADKKTIDHSMKEEVTEENEFLLRPIRMSLESHTVTSEP